MVKPCDFADVWARVDKAVDAPGEYLSESWLDRLIRILWIPKPAWVAVGVVAFAIIVALAYLPDKQAPTLAANDCIIDNIDARDSSVMVYEVGDSKMKVIWVMEQQALQAGETT